MSEPLTVWLAAVVVSASVILPYWLKFQNRLARDRERKAEARRLGIDRPVAQFPFVDALRCIGCGACLDVCPEGDVLGIVGGTAVVVNGLQCVGHGVCETACPVEGIEVGLGDIKSRQDVPLIDDELQTNVPGIFVAGELGGLGLVRNAADQGRVAVETIAERCNGSSNGSASSVVDLVIVGAGPAGLSAALAATSMNLSHVLLEKEKSLGGSLLHYPRRKMILTRPIDLQPWGSLDQAEYQKEELLELFEQMVSDVGLDPRFGQEVQEVQRENGHFRISLVGAEYQARNVLLAIGRRGSPRKLGVPGEDLSKVMYRLMDAQAYRAKKILIVGGGDSAAEAAVGLARQSSNQVTLSYRKEKLVRLKKKNLDTIEKQIAAGRIRALFSSQVSEIRPQSVCLRVGDRNDLEIENDYLFVFAGGVPPFSFLKRIGIRFGGEIAASQPSIH